MTKIKKVMALVIAMLLIVTTLGTTVFAEGETSGTTEGQTAPTVKIEITRDDTYAGTGDGNVYTWYRVFTATYDTVTSTGGDSNNGAPGDITVTPNNAAVSYVANATVAGKLGSWDAATNAWTKATGNLWFELTPIAGTTNYSVKWVGTDSTSATVQAAANWLYSNGVYEASGPLTFADGKFSASGLAKGYYLINGVTGKNLIAATTDITVKEKNEYPPLDKTQADEDKTTTNNDARDVAIGDKLDYEVKVTIPATAKVGDQILVWDKPSSGLTYNNDVAVKENTGNATVADAATEAGQSWAKLITVTADSVGKNVVFSFSMTVNSNALKDSDKKNESGLKYGRDGSYKYESTPDEVKYSTYFTGIKKIDGDTNGPLEGVKFTLKEAGTEFKVTKHTDGYYYPDANGSSEVVTDAAGLVLIRGLDKDKSYTLTETETLPGYNMLPSDVALTLEEDTVTVTTTEEGGQATTTTTSSFETKKGSTTSTWGEVENKKGSVLPGTGGIGTTIFYMIGTLLIASAVVMLYRRRREN